MSNELKVSIIVPVYNVEKYLEQCLDSLIHQTLKEIEIICVNDGATDSSAEILEKYKSVDNKIFIAKNKKIMGLNYILNYFLEVENDDVLSEWTVTIYAT